MAEPLVTCANWDWKSHRAALEDYSVDVVLMIGRGPPAPTILRQGAIFCKIATQTPLITLRQDKAELRISFRLLS